LPPAPFPSRPAQQHTLSCLSLNPVQQSAPHNAAPNALWVSRAGLAGRAARTRLCRARLLPALAHPAARAFVPSIPLRVTIHCTVSWQYEADQPRPSTEADRVVARSVVRVLGRDEVYGAYDGVSESVPPDGGGALVAAAPLRTGSRAFVWSPPTFWRGMASPEI
jgi:hypothetical protein